MEYRKVCSVLQEAWDSVSNKWSAGVKSRYLSKMFLPLLSEAEDMYKRNEDLEEYAKQCVESVRM